MNDLPFWVFPAITFAGLLATGGIVLLMANATRNKAPRLPAASPAEADLFDGTQRKRSLTSKA
ncbi:hypothetical protein FNL55_10790 [Tardiphaga sp. vice352]|uniref:hypothetical protein n=1 Tax=unclassified Tardiphaga TaxID=2631404 RepID=UPI0011635F1E|nr:MULTISPECIES: hypothetical protein [unclassified Tardiphaga]MBC7585365.1 hypothetical protein [Tardiphaga sp.]QDM16472.1 hypothetical protein FNL53_11480 [Tardiphaga sp. vice278]QDM21495.1 hypothetical protein FIU28_10380 [Tardiphaga sp. vice154]QDM26682.1 hypothetical protein FNL56_11635 [Tardiphaga sp. vice304]QDM31747.1 hypothetical protein FNL55_10790 [Tardiphaga sp. vice352]